MDLCWSSTFPLLLGEGEGRGGRGSQLIPNWTRSTRLLASYNSLLLLGSLLSMRGNTAEDSEEEHAATISVAVQEASGALTPDAHEDQVSSPSIQLQQSYPADTFYPTCRQIQLPVELHKSVSIHQQAPLPSPALPLLYPSPPPPQQPPLRSNTTTHQQ